MAIMMTHPIHGTTFAIGGEVEWNKANGWKVYVPPVVKVETVATPAPQVPEAVKVVVGEPEKRKPGRPPAK